MAFLPARPLPAEVRQKLGRLLPMLGAPHDGEKLATATAIGRVLASANLDFHDLTAAILTPAAATRPAQPPPPPPHADVTADELVALVEALRARRRFDRNSEAFLTSLLDRADRYETVFLTPKMWKWLQDLVVRAGL